MSPATPQALLGLLVTEFERRRWRDEEQAALKIVRSTKASGSIDPAALAKIPTQSFFAKNRITRADLEDACCTAFSGQEFVRPLPALITIDDIETFNAVSSVTPQDVVEIARSGLPLLEQTVKEFIGRIVGEPYLEKDWGGELSDIHTSRVVIHSQRTLSAFLLKGRGLRGKMLPKHLGLNGDQIRRLSKQGVELYVVQHVGPVDEAVYDQLRDMVLARRSEGNERVVGSVWDGADCARLFVAHGLIDPDTGQPTPRS